MKRLMLVLLLILLLRGAVCVCDSSNDEGRVLLRFKERVEIDPYGALLRWKQEDGRALDHCSWFGVKCWNGRVVSLILKNLLLKGTLAPGLGSLIYLRSLILHNNSFYGTVPNAFTRLQKLVILDLGHNNLSGVLPHDLRSIPSLETLILRRNSFSSDTSPELCDSNLLSELKLGKIPSSRRGSVTRIVANATMRRLMEEHTKLRRQLKDKENHTAALSPSPAPSPSPARSLVNESLSPSPSESKGNKKSALIISMPIVGGFSVVLVFAALYYLYFRSNKIVARPWATGLSGQLQKALVTGIPALKRTEIMTACEDFSNIIGFAFDCALYKGTLSSGVEILVASISIKSEKEWSNERECHFRKKISILSKVNHKNFVNLLGYCMEDKPFSRMMVFEYAPNGTLFEHLHVKEAEHLDWTMRLRVAMGIAYSLEYMHQLSPPFLLRNLNSSFIYLTEDYAGKVSDIGLWSKTEETELDSIRSDFSRTMSKMSDHVYEFGIILLEMISGKLPFYEDQSLLVHWASSYLKGEKPLKEMIDSTLTTYNENDVDALIELVRSCINPDPLHRPKIQEIVSRLKDITLLSPDGAAPNMSQLWWAELEIISSGLRS